MIKHIVFTFFALNILGCVKNDKTTLSRPNILFIMSDDHAYQAISAYSQKLIHTPNIDKIAESGAIFENACVTNSICAPSRATILTGKHNHINGKIDNRSPLIHHRSHSLNYLRKQAIRLQCLGNYIWK